MQTPDLRSRLLAILAADAAGYSRLMSLDERGTVAALDAARAVFREHIALHGGRVIDTAGDSVLAVFDSAAGAVSAALAAQRDLAGLATGLPEDRCMHFRIGVHLGDVIEKADGTVYGDGVNIAARLQGLAEPGGITVSDSIRHAVKGKVAVSFEDQGEQTVKNIADPVRAYRAHPPGDAPTRPGLPSAAEMSLTVGDIALRLPDKPSIAVLPFTNMSGDLEQGYFADGISEDIITEISRIPALFVIARNSTFTYKGKAAKIQDICRDLGVRYVLEGSVRKSGQRMRVTAQLIDGDTGGHIWAERYDRELADIFAVQDDITEQIVRALEIRLTETTSTPTSRLETENPEAYDCVLRGREQYRLFTKEGNAAARLHYDKAIELDPGYAQAHAGLALTYLHDWFSGSSGALARAFELAQLAKSLDPSLPLVYEALASVLLFRRQHDEAVDAARRWTEIEPSNAEAYASLAGILNFAGQPQRVAELIEKAKRLNPFHPFYYTLYIGQACFLMRRFKDAVQFIKRSIAHDPESLPSHFFVAACHGQLGEDTLAHEALAEVWRISPGFSMASVRAIAAYRRAADLDLLTEGLRKAGLPEEVPRV